LKTKFKDYINLKDLKLYLNIIVLIIQAGTGYPLKYISKAKELNAYIT
jgi:hypothetical protein